MIFFYLPFKGVSSVAMLLSYCVGGIRCGICFVCFFVCLLLFFFFFFVCFFLFLFFCLVEPGRDDYMGLCFIIVTFSEYCLLYFVPLFESLLLQYVLTTVNFLLFLII